MTQQPQETTADTGAYIKARRGGAGVPVYHTDKTCSRLGEARQYREAFAQEVREFRECKECAGTSDSHTGGENDPLVCPVCGESVRNLPNHMRGCDSE